MVCVADTRTVKKFVMQLQMNDCSVEEDYEAGIVRAEDGDIVVYMTLQKGSGGMWIVRCTNSARVEWS